MRFRAKQSCWSFIHPGQKLGKRGGNPWHHNRWFSINSCCLLAPPHPPCALRALHIPKSWHDLVISTLKWVKMGFSDQNGALCLAPAKNWEFLGIPWAQSPSGPFPLPVLCLAGTQPLYWSWISPGVINISLISTEAEGRFVSTFTCHSQTHHLLLHWKWNFLTSLFNKKARDGCEEWCGQSGEEGIP